MRAEAEDAKAIAEAMIANFIFILVTGFSEGKGVNK